MANDKGFAAVIARTDPAMVVVTTVIGDERAGCLVGFHAQVSIEPSRYAVWLSKANHTYRVALLASHLGVHLLDVDDGDLAALFGTHSGDELDKFSRCAWQPGPAGVPLLDRCPHRMVLRRLAMLDDGGDHVLFAGEPLEAESPDDDLRPLRLSAVGHLRPGHGTAERPTPPTERSI